MKKSKWLLPHSYKLVGWMMLIPFMALGIAHMYWDVEFDFLNAPIPTTWWHGSEGDGFSFSALKTTTNNLTDELATFGVILSLVLISFSKEKHEDEFLSYLRLESWQLSVLINYIILMICVWLFYSGAFFQAMVYNMFSVLIIFIIRFYWVKAKTRSYAEQA